ncbi:MAG TPA: cytochrome P460 family protein [Rhodanobacteraceae bacterium]|nr:cytochrome P460 family protein [Rhodanobacteraceae bacterium]
MLPKPLYLALIATAAAIPFAATADNPVAANANAPAYTADGKLILPADYRQWIYLSSGLDMSYNPKALASPDPMFDNTFANPNAWRAFRKTGTWPDKTVIVLEIRGSAGKGSINQRGHYQSGGVHGIEVHVKDTARFPGGWAFFSFDDGTAPAKRIPATEACYSCHSAHGAVDTTFVQFYPTLLPLAKQHGTLSAAYLKDEAERIMAASR